MPRADSIPTMKRVPIFKPGRHTAANGTTLDFSEEQLAASIAAYDPKVHEAPLVIGHPKDNGPAYGWVSALSFADGEVVAETAQVNPDFAEMVASGAFKKRSASFYTPDSPSNPVPGVYYLRHVGFLGAQPPAIKGLTPVEFNDADEGVLEFSDDTYTSSTVAHLFRRLREFMLAQFGQETADTTLPSFHVEDLERAAADKRAKAEQATNYPAFNEDQSMSNTNPTPEQAAQLQRDLEAARARLQELEGQATNFSERENALRAREHAAAVATIRGELDAHVKAGRLLPAHVAPLAEFMASLPDQGEAVEFGEPVNGATPKLSQRAFLAAFVAQLPKAVEFGEVAGGPGPSAGDLTGEQIAEKARAHIKKVREETGREVSYVEAVNHVCAEASGE